MRIEFKKSFLKESKKLRNKHLKDGVFNCIKQVESVQNVSEIRNLKKLSGFDVYYRIRVGDYRIGVKIEREVVYFVVFEHRKDIYKGFP